MRSDNSWEGYFENDKCDGMWLSHIGEAIEKAFGRELEYYDRFAATFEVKDGEVVIRIRNEDPKEEEAKNPTPAQLKKLAAAQDSFFKLLPEPVQPFIARAFMEESNDQQET